MARTTQRIVHEAMKKIHPLTGAPLEPIGSFVRKDGTTRIVWPVLGAADDDGAGDGSDGAGDGGSGSEGQDGNGDGKDGDKKDDSGADNGSKSVSTEEFEALKRRMIAADKRASEAEAKAKEYEDKDKDELTKAKEAAEAVEKERDALAAATNSLRIENEFLASNKYSWHNPKRALQVADLSEVNITEDGKVEGLDKALDALAKSDPYLLKSSDDSDDKDKPDGKSGSAHNGRKSGDGKVDKDALAKKYPALRR